MRIIIVDEDLVDALPEIPLVDPDAAPRIPLRVHVHQEGLSLRHGQRSGQVDRSRGLSNATLLIGYADCFGHIPVELRLVVESGGPGFR